LKRQHRGAALHLERNLLEIAGVAQIAAAAHDILGPRHLDHTAADITVAGADGARELSERAAVGLQFLRIDDDLVLLNEAAQACDFSGLTLGGGLGRLVRKHGLALDNLVSADVVTADGKLLIASASQNEDLFWALRGGGGNFGVVASFEFQVHPAGMVLAGLVLHPASAGKEALQVLARVRTESLGRVHRRRPRVQCARRYAAA
jgi:FAD/FMN-containing dehydrogenase